MRILFFMLILKLTFLASMPAFVTDSNLNNQNINSQKLQALLFCSEDLRKELLEEPDLIKKYDENNWTILHHAARIGLLMGNRKAGEVLDILFAHPRLDLTIRDKKNNTPVHVAAIYSRNQTTCNYVFPRFIKIAQEKNFDFSSLGGQGKTILQIAAMISYTDPGKTVARVNNVAQVLGGAQNPALDALSSTGATALFYAINHGHLQEANTLLKAGANVNLFGHEDRNPKIMIDTLIAGISHQLNSKQDPKRLDSLQEHKKALEKIRQKMANP